MAPATSPPMRDVWDLDLDRPLPGTLDPEGWTCPLDKSVWQNNRGVRRTKILVESMA